MNIRARTLAPIGVAVATFALYAPFLQHAPVYLAHDEVFFSVQAHSIATTWRDLDGRLMPLYFHILKSYWAQPILIYSTALLLKVLPLSETAIRLPSVLVGVADVVLMYFLARQLFADTRLALVAAGILALTPAHVLFSRVGVDPLYPLPFLMAWLLCLVHFEERNQRWLLFVGTLSLGLGFYSYAGSILTMPLYVCLTCLLLVRRKESAGAYLVALGGFVAPLLPLIVWVLQHPTVYSDQVARYQLYDPGQISGVHGVWRLIGYPSLTERSGVYWNAFNLSFLFFSGDSSVLNSTRHAGVFLLPIAALLPIGINQIVNVARTRFNLLLLFGFLSAPVGVVLVAEIFIARQLVMLPFAVLISTFGVAHLLSSRMKRWRAIGVVLLALMPLQFAYFYFDYFTDYRVRSAGWFEHNLRGGLEEIIASDRERRVAAVYLNSDIPWVDWYWRFYVIKHDRRELLGRTVYIDPKRRDLREIPKGGVFLTTAAEAAQDAVLKSGDFRKTRSIADLGGAEYFSLFER